MFNFKLYFCWRYPDDGAGGGAPPATTDPAPASAEPLAHPDGKPGLTADIDALLRDKAFQTELAKQVAAARAGWEKEAQARIKTARTEGEKLAKLSDDERAKAEAAKSEEALSEREKAADAREAELARKELRAAAVDTLVKRGLPQGLAGSLNYSSAEACQESIEAVEKSFREAVREGVDAKLPPKEPPKGGGVGKTDSDPFLKGFDGK